ncbi:AAA family ATPase [Blastomonas fulva]|jgi:hypothetical protein|uniref:AAA family ATPase n=1 Tax=Blastomonas fulva TaxID=1550728 RepID=UPI003D2C710E
MSDYLAIPFTVGFNSEHLGSGNDWEDRWQHAVCRLEQTVQAIVRMGGILTRASPSQVGDESIAFCFVAKKIHEQEILGRLYPERLTGQKGCFDGIVSISFDSITVGGHIWNSRSDQWWDGGETVRGVELAHVYSRILESPTELRDRQKKLIEAIIAATPEYQRRENENDINWGLRLAPVEEMIEGPNRHFGRGDMPPHDRLPKPGETAEQWAKRVAVDGQALIDEMDLFERCDKDPLFYMALRPSAEETQFRFLVDGLFPFGVVSLVAGDGGVGKSTMLTELCAVVGSQSTDERTFLGRPVNERGICMFFSGEDNPSFLMERQEFYQRQGHANASQCFLIGAAGRSFDECISMVRRYKDRVKLAVFDPASKFFTGGNDNDAIDPQIGKLDALAAETGCAVVLVHHLTKGRVQQFSHMRDKIRGAGAFVNRPRLVLGIMRKGAEAARIVEIGILKHNIPPSQALWGELGKGRLFYQNPETLRLDPLEDGQQRQGRLPSAENGNNVALERWVLDTVRQRVASGGEVRKTGRKSLHQGQQETGGSYSRLAIERAQDSLIAAGLLLDTEAGLQICEPPSTE